LVVHLRELRGGFIMKRSLIIAPALSVLAVIGLGSCGSSSNTNSSSSSATAWTPPDSGKGEWTTTFTDDFSKPDKVWTSGAGDVTYENGALKIVEAKSNSHVYDLHALGASPKKLSIEADITYDGGPVDSSAFLVCEEKGQQDLAVGFKADGTGLIFRELPQGTRLLAEPKHALPPMNVGDTRHFIVDCLPLSNTIDLQGRVGSKAALQAVDPLTFGGDAFPLAGFAVSTSAGGKGGAAFSFDNLVVHSSQ
jgi:hypothetical protein